MYVFYSFFVFFILIKLLSYIDFLRLYLFLFPDLIFKVKVEIIDEISFTMTLVYNVIRYDETRDYFIKINRLVDIIKPFLTIDEKSIQLMSIFSLAYVAREDRAELFRSNSSIIRYAVKSLEEVVHNRQENCDNEWTAYELARGIGRLAVNDSNKKLLVENGALNPLHRLTLSEDEDEAFGMIIISNIDQSFYKYKKFTNIPFI